VIGKRGSALDDHRRSAGICCLFSEFMRVEPLAAQRHE